MAKLNLREELRNEQIAEQAAKPEAKLERFELVPKELSFTLSYDAPDGNCYVADLISIAPDGECRAIKARALARLLAGLSLSQLSRDEQMRMDAIARVIAQTKGLPDWVEQWMACDNELLANLNVIIGEHETRYFRGNSLKGEGDQGQPRVRINSPFSKEPTTP